jgi:hypothetical protein
MITLQSQTTGRRFSVYMLPQLGSEPSTVPVLVGMSHLGPNRAIIDLGTGDMVYANIKGSQPTRMPKNKKGHYLVDIVGFLIGNDL